MGLECSAYLKVQVIQMRKTIEISYPTIIVTERRGSIDGCKRDRLMGKINRAGLQRAGVALPSAVHHTDRL
jgi:hypothetical protein